jgi:methylenetetrahydrofolate dehydrogenase (NADP+)/methenyltetrahydrofolate cyclohydrolase
MEIIDGKKLANKILDELKKKIKKRETNPGLAVILVGKDPASLLYVKNKKRAAEKIGVKFELYKYGANTANRMLIMRIKELNKRKDIDGIIVQLPLPRRLNADKIISAIDAKKDVDGFRLNSRHVSPVAQAVMILLKAAKASLKNKKAVIFVNNPLFAAPIKKMIAKKGVKVLIVIKPSVADLKKYGRQSDLVIIALGRPHVLKSEMIKNGATVIDVGTTPTSSPYFRKAETGGVRGGVIFKFVGDLDPRGLMNKKGFYTPVPGGVGPVTVAMLLKNVVKSSQIT